MLKGISSSVISQYFVFSLCRFPSFPFLRTLFFFMSRLCISPRIGFSNLRVNCSTSLTVSSKKSIRSTAVTESAIPKSEPITVMRPLFGDTGISTGSARSITSTEPAPTTRIKNSGAISAIILQIAADTSGSFVVALMRITSVSLTAVILTYSSKCRFLFSEEPIAVSSGNMFSGGFSEKSHEGRRSVSRKR